MLSLIVCSINPDFLSNLKENVASTIGLEHEWLVWDNRETGKGICEVYNSMAGTARYPYLCFLHEDLLFKTAAWGKLLIGILQTQDAKLLGIAGSNYKSSLYSGWYSGGGARDYSNIYHRLNDHEYHLCIPEKWEPGEAEVVSIDGVFMACPKTSWEKTRFNEQLLKGFHFYDIDFSLRVARTGKVIVTNRIAMIHLTVGGDFGDKWVEQAFLFHDAMKGELPFTKDPVDIEKADRALAVYWLDWLKNYPVSFSNRRKWVLDQQLQRQGSLWYSIAKFFLYRPLGLKYIHKLFKKNSH